MLTLTIGNSICKLEGLTTEQYRSLREVLSYKLPPTQLYFSGNVFNTKKYLIDKNGHFPTGLLYLVQKWLKLQSIKSTTYDGRVRPNALQSIIMHGPATRVAASRRNEPINDSRAFKPYPEQVEAAEAAVANTRGIIVAPTGLGKSMIVALIIDKLKVPTLVVVPSLELKRQLTAYLMSVFGKTGHILVENVDALSLSGNFSKFGCVIIDEFHHSAAKTYRELNKKGWNGIYYKFGLTATPFRSQDRERLLLESVLSAVIYEISHEKAVSANYIVPMEAYYIDLPKVKVKGHTWSQVYHELVANNEYRNHIIAGNLVNRLRYYGKSTLCLVKEIAHGNQLMFMTGADFANGMSDNTKELIEKFNKNEITTLIGTTGVLGEGVDTKPAEYIIIAGLGKSKNQFMQQVGRGFRKYPGKESCKIILFRDPSHKWTLQHFQTQCKILLQEYGVIPVKLDL